MEGYLHKRGRGKNISIYKPYARRFFVLTASTQELTYYTDESQKTHRGVVNVAGSDIAELTKASTGKSFCFELKCHVGKPHEESLTLAAPNEEQLVQWIMRIHEVGGGKVTWAKERPNTGGTQQQGEKTSSAKDLPSDEPDVNPENIKSGNLILQTKSFFPWKFQACTLNYDFKELSFTREEASGLSSSRQHKSTIDLVGAVLSVVESPPRHLEVHSTEGSDTTGVDIFTVVQIYFMDARGKQTHSFAFQSQSEYADWKSAFKECGCEIDGGDIHISLPPKPPFTPSSASTTSYEYQMNDIDEDSVHSSLLHQDQSYEMNDIDEDSVPSQRLNQSNDDINTYAMNDIDEDSAPPQFQEENPSQKDDIDDNSSFFLSDDETDSEPVKSPSSGKSLSESNLHPMSPAQSHPESEHPRAHLFDLINRNESGELSMTEFMIGLRRREEVVKALRLPTHCRDEDGSRDKYVDVFNTMDDDQAHRINRRKFLKYMDMLDAKAHQQQYVDDPISYFNKSSPHGDQKDDSLYSSPESVQSSSDISNNTFYGKIAKKIQVESARKRNLSIAIRSEDISNVEPLKNETFIAADTQDDFLTKFRNKNGMNSAAHSYEDERKSTDFNGDGGTERSINGSEYSDERTQSASSILADLKFIVLEAVHPAKGVRTRLRLRSLFRDDPTNIVDFSVVQKFFQENFASESSSPPDFFPYLKKGPCSWYDCNRYLRHCEQMMKPNEYEFKFKIEISLPVSGYSCVITSPALSWVHRAARKIKTIPLSDIHLLSQKQIIDLIQQQHSVDFVSQISTLCLIEMSGAENYVQFLEEYTKCFSKSHKVESRDIPASSEEDDIDKSFMAADKDNDGNISRAEWRRVMADREGILRTANEDRRKLIDENNRLRKSLDMDREFSLGSFREKRTENLERYLDVKNEEIQELKLELEACKREIKDLNKVRPNDNEQNSHDYSNSLPFDNENSQHQMFELPEDIPNGGNQHRMPQHIDLSSPPQSVCLSLSESVPPISIPDHYSEHEALHHQESQQGYVERLLASQAYGKEESTGWAKRTTSSPSKKNMFSKTGSPIPPSINEASRRNAATESKSRPPNSSPDIASQHPLRRALINNTKTLDLTPLSLTARTFASHTPKHKVPHKSFKDHTTASRGKQLQDKVSGFYSGVRSPGNWSNSQAHLEYE